MEFVIVRFRESRNVLIDGNEGGFTNKTIRVNQGFHTFSLAGACDYTPSEQTVKIEDTTEAHPQEVNFA